jgi:TetR/AcrR family transcriptional regulator, cholesterol catabolism regulator
MENKITKDKIVKAALPIFMKRGYKGATMREIATSMGIKAGSLYYHIRSKDEILEKIHDVLIDGVLEKSEKIVFDNTISRRKKFELFIEGLLRTMAELRPYAVVFFSDYKYLSPYFLKKINNKRKRCQEFLREIMKDGINQGEFRPMDTKIISIGIFGMFMWAHTWINPNGRLRIEEIAKIFSDMLSNGICCEREKVALNNTQTQKIAS